MGPLQGFLYSEQHREKKGKKTTFGSKMPIIGDFPGLPMEGCQQCWHNRPAAAPKLREGTVLLVTMG